MICFPAIDLIAGNVVRLERGQRSKMTVYSEHPAEVAKDFAARGAQWIHVVNLSAAFEEDEEAQTRNLRAIEAICAEEGISVDVGGGVRDMKAIKRLVNVGAKRVAIGTALVRNPDFAQEAAACFGSMLVADVAARDGEVRVNGWREGEGIAADALVKRLANLGFSHLVFTDVARDGMQTGIDASLYTHLAHVAGFPVVASGGIASLHDVEALAALGSQVIEGFIVGRSLYEGNLSLEDALELSKG